MSEESLQRVLRCGRCNKPFDKPSTLKRHGYYCRSRIVGRTGRTRSCTACAKVKTRCDNTQPVCGRCMTRGIECRLPTRESALPKVKAWEKDVETKDRSRLSPSFTNSICASQTDKGYQPSDKAEGPTLKSTIASSDLASPGLDCYDIDVDFDQFPEFDIMEEYIPQYPPNISSSFLTKVDDSISFIESSQEALFDFSSYTVPTSPTTTVRCITERALIQPGHSKVASLLRQNLRSYPLAMMRANKLPPFIHTHSLACNAKEDSTETLNNCISLIHMISSERKGSRKLFWKNVRMECEQFCEDRSMMSMWGLLAAIQALLVYILIRLDEGEKDYNNFDALLLKTVTVLVKQMGPAITSEPNIGALCEPQSLKDRWHNWLFEESARRICVVYQTINMLVYFEPATLCDIPLDLIFAPLPSNKALWDSMDEHQWELEMEKRARVSFALAADGDLFSLNGAQRLGSQDAIFAGLLSDENRRMAAGWSEWCSGMDELGGLAMLAAVLVA